MAHGGARPGAGRKKGAGIQKTRADAERLLGDGLTPLDYMVGVLRQTMEFDANRFKAAEAAAPFMHAKLAAVAHEGSDGGAIVVEIVDYGASGEDPERLESSALPASGLARLAGR